MQSIVSWAKRGLNGKKSFDTKEKEGLSGSRILTLFGMRPPAFGLPQV